MKSRYLSLLLLALIGCGEKEKTSESREMAVSACMSQVPETLGAYFEGQATEAQTDSVFNCITDSLKLFTERTKGRIQGEYTIEELHNFIERYFVQGKKLNPGLTAEALELKAALFGGSPTLITTAEIDAFKHFLKPIRDASQLIRPVMPLSLEKSTDSDLDRAAETAELLGRAFSRAKGNYALDHAFKLAAEIQSAIHLDGLGFWLERRQLIETGMRVLISNPQGIISPNDWKHILITAHQALRMGRHAKVWSKQTSSFFDEPGFNAWDKVYSSTTELLSSAIERSPNQALKATDLVEWLNQLHKANLASIQPAVFQQFLVFKKSWLGGSSDDLTRKDIEQSKVWVKRFHEAGTKLKPHFPIQLDSSDAAIQALNEIVQTWAGWLEQSASPIAFSDIKNFLSAVQIQFTSPEFASATKNFDSYVSLFQWVRKSKSPHFQPKDWPVLTKLLMDALSIYRSQNDLDQLLTRTADLLTWIGHKNQNQKLVWNDHSALWSDTFTLGALSRLKKPIAGGDTHTITANELKKIVITARDLRSAAQPLEKLWPESLHDNKKIHAFQNQLSKVFSVLQSFSEPVSWSILVDIVKDLHGRNPQSFFKKFLARETFFKEIAQAFFAPNIEKISPSDWKVIQNSIQLGLSAAISAQTLLSSELPIFWGVRLDQTQEAGLRILQWLNHVVKTRSTQSITIAQLMRIITGLKDEEVPLGLQKSTLSTFIGPFVSRNLNHINIDETPESEVLRIGITPSTVKDQIDELEKFIAVQKALPKLFLVTDCLNTLKPQMLVPGLTPTQLEPVQNNPFQCFWELKNNKKDPYKLEIEKSDLLNAIQKYRALDSLGLSPAAVSVVKELVFTSTPLFPTDGDHLIFPTQKNLVTININTLSHLHWTRVISKNIIRGYAKDPARANALTGITEEEMKIFIDDVKPLGLELFVIDPLTQNMHGKRFFEGTHFTSTAKGLSLIDVGEFAEMILFLKSGGSMALAPNAALYKRCPTLEGHGYGYPFIDSECFRKEFYSDAIKFWKNLPKMAAFYNALTDANKKLFRELLEFCGDTYALTVDSKWMTSADTRTIMVLLQYIEALLKRFDRNDTGTIELGSWKPFNRLDEVTPIWPVFKGKISEVAKGITIDYVLYSAFTYMLSTGQIPVSGTYEFNKWLGLGKFATFQSDRMIILKIFAEIQRSLNTKPDDSKP